MVTVKLGKACGIVDLISRTALAAVTSAKTGANARRLIIMTLKQQALDAFRYEVRKELVSKQELRTSHQTP
jgi:hypothetical protein